MKDPETHQIIEGLAAQAMLLIFGTKDYLQAGPRGIDDYEKARLLSRVIMAVLDGRGVFRTLYQAWKDAFIFGTAILEFSWESKARQQIAPVHFMDEQGQPQVAWVPQMVKSREGPLIGQVDRFDFYEDPGGSRIQENMGFVAKRFRITRQQAEALGKSGVYDSQAVREAFEGVGEGGSSGGSAIGGPERFPDKNSAPKASKTGHFIGFEGWGFVPGKHADGSSNRVITQINGKLVRSTMNPHFRGVIPFKEIVVNPLTGRFDGLSPNEVNRFLQDFADHMRATSSMAATDMVRPRSLINLASGINPDEIAYGKRWIEASGDLSNAVYPIPMQYNAIQFAGQTLQEVKLAMRGSAGSLDPLGDTLGGDRMAATTTSEIVRLASQRGELMATLSEREDFPFIGSMIHGLLRQFSPDEGVIAMYNGEPMKVPFEAINIDADIRFVGSRRAQSKFQRVAAYKDAIATITQGMGLIPAMPELFVRYLRDGLEIDDGEQIVAQAAGYVQQQQAQAMAMEQAKAAPSPGGSMPGATETSFGTETGQTEREGRRVA
jgi:hypothetical protein